MAVKFRKYILETTLGPGEVEYSDDQMKSLVNQFKRHIELETGTTDKAVGTDTRSVDDAHDDMGNPGIKFTKEK